MKSSADDPHQSSASLRSNTSLFSRRDLIRAAMWASAAAALGPAFSFAQAIDSGLTPAAHGEDGSKVLTDPNWKLVFLNDHQNQTLIALSEVIIPSSDSPGAKEALANRFIDLLLSGQPVEFQRQFVDALAYMDTASQTEFGKDFVALSSDDQVWLLTPWAYAHRPDHWIQHEEKADPGELHFARLKALIAASYYGSEIGQKELGWDGEFTHGPYEGCQHESGTHT